MSMDSVRFRGALAGLLMVGAALASGTAIASADFLHPTAQDEAYLAKIKSLGFGDTVPGFSYNAFFIPMGPSICSAKKTESPDEITHNLQVSFKGSAWENGNFAGLRDAAESVYCP